VVGASPGLKNILIAFETAKKAGNTGVDNYIVSAHDVLLNNKWITKDNYDKLFKTYFI